MKINPGKGTKYIKRLYVYTNKQTNGQRAITLKPYKMKITKTRKGEYKIQIKGETYNLLNDICIETGKNRGWNLYDESGEWCGSSDTKKQMIKSLK